MKKFRKVLDGLTTSSPVNPGGSPACGSAAGTPSAAPTPRELEIQETLMSEHFQICKVGAPPDCRKGLVCHCSRDMKLVLAKRPVLINADVGRTVVDRATIEITVHQQQTQYRLHKDIVHRQLTTDCILMTRTLKG